MMVFTRVTPYKDKRPLPSVFGDRTCLNVGVGLFFLSLDNTDLLF